jgi:anti-sigma28 factor (negative regulator of flagellin synthesis)
MEALRRDDRTKRLSVLARTVEAGNYQVPAEYVADAIIYSSSRRSFDPFRQSE